MDGENNASQPYFQMDDLGGSPPLCLGWHPWWLKPGGVVDSGDVSLQHHLQLTDLVGKDSSTLDVRLEVRIKGDRISGWFHPKEYPIIIIKS